MKLRTSKFKTKDGYQWLVDWHQKVMDYCQLDYQALVVDSQFGKTHVWAKNHEDKNKPALVFLPGFRTCGIFWDLNNTLAPFYDTYRIYLVDVIGQPSLSSGTSPSVKGDGYGHWLKELLDQLGLDKVTVSGASFGGQLMIKLATVAPERVQRLVGFNPVGIQNITMSPKVMWNSMLTILAPSRKNATKFIDRIVFDSRFQLEKGRRELLLEYQHYAMKNFKFGSDYPYKYSVQELKAVVAPIYLILCKNDVLISSQNTANRAKSVFSNYKKTILLSEIGHGIELAPAAFVELEKIVKEGE